MLVVFPLYAHTLSNTHFLSLLQLHNQITVSSEIFSFRFSRTFSVQWHFPELGDPAIAGICGAFDRVVPPRPRSFFWCRSAPEIAGAVAGPAARCSEALR
ncbi:hypothetical protein E2542_SST28744 [Spatholobus suberectus]|nr:hypothetical protein E2542_SST28744 [Spatholobus suberectus]